MDGNWLEQEEFYGPKARGKDNYSNRKAFLSGTKHGFTEGKEGNGGFGANKWVKKDLAKLITGKLGTWFRGLKWLGPKNPLKRNELAGILLRRA